MSRGNSLAIAACKLVLPRLSAITGAVAKLITVDALDPYFVGVLGGLFGATARRVAKFWKIVREEPTLRICEACCLTIATHTLRDPTLHGRTGILQALQVDLGALGPARCLYLTLGLGAQVEPDLVLLIQLTLKAYVSKSNRKLFLLNASGQNNNGRTLSIRVTHSSD